jgi:hypothetical protein
MAPHGAVTLAELRLRHLEVRCRRCARAGRLSVARLIAEHGPEMGLPDLRAVLAEGCAKASAPVEERCSVWFPQLLEPGAITPQPSRS